MRVRIGRREFVPRAWATLLTAAALAAFVSLGFWQVGRAREKQALIESFAQGTRTSVEWLSDVSIDELPRYQHLRAEGRYEPAHQVLLDNMPSHSGRPGYRVLTPFRRAGSERMLLVDRGWVPLGATREVMPSLAVAAAHRAVSGRLDQLPVPGVRVGDATAPGDQRWPRVMNFPRASDLEKTLGGPVESRILLLDPAAPDGYERAWRPSLRFGPERHLGYALQWFTLALVAVVIFIALSLQRVVVDGEQPRGSNHE